MSDDKLGQVWNAKKGLWVDEKGINRPNPNPTYSCEEQEDVLRAYFADLRAAKEEDGSNGT